jgi:hypothetical protein
MKKLASVSHNNSITINMMRLTFYEITLKNVLCINLIWNLFKFGICIVQAKKVIIITIIRGKK